MTPGVTPRVTSGVTATDRCASGAASRVGRGCGRPGRGGTAHSRCRLGRDVDVGVRVRRRAHRQLAVLRRARPGSRGFGRFLLGPPLHPGPLLCLPFCLLGLTAGLIRAAALVLTVFPGRLGAGVGEHARRIADHRSTTMTTAIRTAVPAPTRRSTRSQPVRPHTRPVRGAPRFLNPTVRGRPADRPLAQLPPRPHERARAGPPRKGAGDSAYLCGGTWCGEVDADDDTDARTRALTRSAGR